MTDRCNVCSRILPVSALVKSSNSATGYVRRCKECVRGIARVKRRDPAVREKERLAAAARYAENPEAAREAARRYRHRHPEKSRESNRKWRAENKKKMSEINRRSYLRDVEASRERSARHKRRRPDLNRLNAKRYKHRKRGSVVDLSAEDHERIIRGPCEFCGTKENLTLAHDIPVSAGGSTTLGNVFCPCVSCNSRMHTRTRAEVLPLVESGLWNEWRDRLGE